jgi:DNA-directed RNA polymerase subunit RPC12/RpoP
MIGAIMLMFSCEHCGKRFQVDESAQGKRGRCKDCGHVMRIPHAGAAKVEHAHVAGEARAHSPESPFRLSPAEPPPGRHHEIAAPHHEPVRPSHQGEPRHPYGEPDTEFELIVDQAELAAAIPAPPEVLRGIREIEEFKKDPSGYKIVGDRGGRFFSFFGGGGDRPASWLYVRWRAGITGILKVLRFIDDWAYLISVPFLVLVLFAIVTSSRGLVHAGAVVVVLVNYGRFWADFIAFFVRPFQDGPIQGLAFLFPPYTVYYLFAHWGRMKPILRRMLTSCIPIVLVILAYAFLPSVNPEFKDVHGVRARLKIGAEVLEKDIRGGLKQIEGELSDVAEKKEPPPPDKP